MYCLDYTIIANEILILLDKRFVQNFPFADTFLHTQTVQFFYGLIQKVHMFTPLVEHKQFWQLSVVALAENL